MDKFLRELERALKNSNIPADEKKEVLSYYEEIINDRLMQGEEFENILRSYNVSDIIMDIKFNTIPNHKTPRNVNTNNYDYKDDIKSSYQKDEEIRFVEKNNIEMDSKPKYSVQNNNINIYHQNSKVEQTSKNNISNKKKGKSH